MTAKPMKLKKMNYTKSLCSLGVCLALSSISQLSHAGAWVAAKGNGYNKLSYNSYSADEFEGENADFGEFDSTQVTFYGEYGLGNNFGIFGSLSHQDLEQTDASGNATTGSGLSDLEIGIKYQWQADPFVLSTSLLVKLPYLYDENDPLPTGNGQEDVEFKVLIGKSLYPYGYFGVEAGYRYRADAPSDEYRYLIEYGYDITEQVYFRTKLDGILSANNADADPNAPVGNLSLVPEFDLGKLELTVGYNFKQGKSKSKWGIEFTYTDEIYGDNALQGETLSLGITRVF
ncbi:hypothetical protein [Agaribacter flavus]|uniref:Porin n=1 Tax=Agaribacter flavus TaxID=1902781 RepID=A0ABV7FMN1_9ALTE